MSMCVQLHFVLDFWKTSSGELFEKLSVLVDDVVLFDNLVAAVFVHTRVFTTKHPQVIRMRYQKLNKLLVILRKIPAQQAKQLVRQQEPYVIMLDHTRAAYFKWLVHDGTLRRAFLFDVTLMRQLELEH